MNTKKAMKTPAPTELCKECGLPEGTTIGVCVGHLVKRFHEQGAEKPVVNAEPRGYDAEAVIFAIIKLQMFILCDADHKLLCDTIDDLKRSGAIPPERDLTDAEKRDAAWVAEKLMRGGEIADEQKRPRSWPTTSRRSA